MPSTTLRKSGGEDHAASKQCATINHTGAPFFIDLKDENVRNARSGGTFCGLPPRRTSRRPRARPTRLVNRSLDISDFIRTNASKRQSRATGFVACHSRSVAQSIDATPVSCPSSFRIERRQVLISQARSWDTQSCHAHYLDIYIFYRLICCSINC